MNYQKNIKQIIKFLLAAVILVGCQKMDHPLLGDYPKDSNPPGGPLKFYAAMDGSDVDSIRANFGTDNSVTYVDGGVTGQAAQIDGSKNGYIAYSKPNDFAATANDFTISFWMNISAAQKDHDHAVGIMALANTLNYTNGAYHKDGFWGNFTIFADHETSTSDSMPLKLTLFKAQDSSTSFDAAGWRWPGMYDNKWHLVTFTYTASSSLLVAYKDGEKFNDITIPGVKFDFASQFIVGGFQEAAGIVSDYGSNTWMAGFPGIIDNVRLYSEALSDGDVKALYDNKQ